LALLGLADDGDQAALAHREFAFQGLVAELSEEGVLRELEIAAVVVDLDAVDLSGGVDPDPDLEGEDATVEDLWLGARVDENCDAQKIADGVLGDEELRLLVLGIELEAQQLLEVASPQDRSTCNA
jgi:hypothetical protein